MLRTRIILIVITAAVVAVIFFLPKVVVQNEKELASEQHADTVTAHTPVSKSDQSSINRLRNQFGTKKNSIFADSLWQLYTSIGKFDSAAWFAEQSASFSKTTESYLDSFEDETRKANTLKLLEL